MTLIVNEVCMCLCVCNVLHLPKIHIHVKHTVYIILFLKIFMFHEMQNSRKLCPISCNDKVCLKNQGQFFFSIISTFCRGKEAWHLGY